MKKKDPLKKIAKNGQKMDVLCAKLAEKVRALDKLIWDFRNAHEVTPPTTKKELDRAQTASVKASVRFTKSTAAIIDSVRDLRNIAGDLQMYHADMLVDVEQQLERE